jgi:PAS domain S-box-containing protein
MPYKVELSCPLPNNARVVIPISMGQPLETGERLAALLEAVKDCDVTVLICDTLNRHNSNEESARKQGDDYLAAHAEFLTQVKIERWREWLTERQAKFEDKLILIEKESQPESDFYGKMVKTANKCLSNQKVDNSLKYQREEYSAILNMSEFDYLIYPKRIKDHIISQMAGSLYWKDRQGKYLGCNKAFADLVGLKSIEEIVGKSDHELFAASLGKERVKAITALDQSVIQAGSEKTEEEVGINKNGEIAFYTTRKMPLRDENDRIIGLIGSSIDITKQKQAEIVRNKLLRENKKTRLKLQKARHKLEGMTAVSANIAHELRTPLAALSVKSNNLQKYLPELIAAYRMARTAQLPVSPIPMDRVELLERVVETMELEIRSAFTFIDMQLINLNASIPKESNEIFSFADCLQETLTRYPFQSDEKELIQVIIKQDFMVKAKKLLLIHVFFNLIKNALYYIAAAGKGKITVTLEGGTDYNKVYFLDTGAGISQTVLPHIFKRFFSKTKHGAGVGLTFCKSVMEALGGNIVCESKEGEYSLFTLTFPRLEQK